MKGEHLAITSVPIQRWGALYEDCEAIQTGTIFRELNMPFYAAPDEVQNECGKAEPVSEEQRQRENLMKKIMETCFALDDLTLYLDMHETDEEAIRLFLQKSQERAELKKEFARLFYPLTRDCIPDAKTAEGFSWQDGPMPWEGACV